MIFLSTCNQLRSVAFTLTHTLYLTFEKSQQPPVFSTSCSSHAWVFYYSLFLLGRILILRDVQQIKKIKGEASLGKVAKAILLAMYTTLEAPRSPAVTVSDTVLL